MSPLTTRNTFPQHFLGCILTVELQVSINYYNLYRVKDLTLKEKTDPKLKKSQIKCDQLSQENNQV